MNRQFPALSGIAMVLIVLNHTIEMGTKVPMSHGYAAVVGWPGFLLDLLQALGVFAVPTFLFISGTFVSYAARGEPPTLTAKFLIGSVSHILWPYLVWSAAFYALVFMQFSETYTPFGYCRNLLVGYPFHFIPLLLLCYVVAPWLVRAGRRHSGLLLGLLAAYQLFLLTLLHTNLLPASLKILVPPAVGRTLSDWAVYFPLGLIYGMHMRVLLPRLQRLKVPLAVSSAGLFLLGLLHYNHVLHLPLVGNAAPLAWVLVMPVVERGSIPLVGRLENIGKRSYGLYLTHLFVLDLILWAIAAWGPGLFHYRLMLLPLLFLAALTLPLLTMNSLARSPARVVFRHLFG